MISLRTLPATLALLALVACANPDRFSGDTNTVNLNGGITDPDAFDPLNPADPASTAYFNQTVGDRVLFAVDQSTLSPAAQDVLARQATWLQANPEYTALIEGHADEQGTRQYNLSLGERRANAVREYLISRGVAANRLTTISYGKERPLEICSEEACYAQNRRAVTVLKAGVIG